MDVKSGDSLRLVNRTYQSIYNFLTDLFDGFSELYVCPSLLLVFVYLQLVNHGIPVELLERAKKVCSECYKLREEGFKKSKLVQLLNKLVHQLETKRAPLSCWTRWMGRMCLFSKTITKGHPTHHSSSSALDRLG